MSEAIETRRIMSVKNKFGAITRYFVNADDTLEECPMDNAAIASKCVLNYTNKEGKVYYTQQGETNVVNNNGEYIITKHHCKMGKGEKEKSFLSIWSHDKVKNIENGKQPFPLLKLEIGDDETNMIVAAIKSL